jgi:hypothetical protein
LVYWYVTVGKFRVIDDPKVFGLNFPINEKNGGRIGGLAISPFGR